MKEFNKYSSNINTFLLSNSFFECTIYLRLSIFGFQMSMGKTDALHFFETYL